MAFGSDRLEAFAWALGQGSAEDEREAIPLQMQMLWQVIARYGDGVGLAGVLYGGLIHPRRVRHRKREQ